MHTEVIYSVDVINSTVEIKTLRTRQTRFLENNNTKHKADNILKECSRAY
jgi:hypothetical protein